MTIPTYDSLIPDLAKHLATLGVGQWSDTGVYTKATPPQMFWGIIPDTVAYGIGIQVYADDATRDDVTRDVYVQIRARGDRHPKSADQILDRIFTALHDKTRYRLNNQTTVLLSRRVIKPAPERDSNQMWTRADSWKFTLTKES